MNVERWDRCVPVFNVPLLTKPFKLICALGALALGLVNRVLPPDELLPATLAYARDLAVNCSPTAMAAIKRQVLDDWERSSEESRLRAIVTVSEVSAGGDLAEGVASFAEKRPPRFAPVSVDLNIEKGWYR